MLSHCLRIFCKQGGSSSGRSGAEAPSRSKHQCISAKQEAGPTWLGEHAAAAGARNVGLKEEEREGEGKS